LHLRIQRLVVGLDFFVLRLDGRTRFAFFVDFGFEALKAFLGSGQLDTGDGFPDEVLGLYPAIAPTGGPNLGETGLPLGRPRCMMRCAVEGPLRSGTFNTSEM
jgi:hypothetical protein